MPGSFSRACMAGSARNARTAVLSRSTTAGEVPCGARSAVQERTANPGPPNSATVNANGTSTSIEIPSKAVRTS